MTRSQNSNPPVARQLLYSGAAGKVWTDGLELYGLKARGVGVSGVMPGGPTSQPSSEEMAAVNTAGLNAFGPLKPWMLFVAMSLLVLAMALLHTPLWFQLLVGLAMAAVIVGVPVYKQYNAFQGLFRARDELTLLLSDVPTQMVSSVVEVGPNTGSREIGAAQQPVAVVVRGLPVAERVKLAGAVTRHVALSQRRKA